MVGCGRSLSNIRQNLQPSCANHHGQAILLNPTELNLLNLIPWAIWLIAGKAPINNKGICTTIFVQQNKWGTYIYLVDDGHLKISARVIDSTIRTSRSYHAYGLRGVIVPIYGPVRSPRCREKWISKLSGKNKLYVRQMDVIQCRLSLKT